jgi:hypothetical protein
MRWDGLKLINNGLPAAVAGASAAATATFFGRASRPAATIASFAFLNAGVPGVMPLVSATHSSVTSCMLGRFLPK